MPELLRWIIRSAIVPPRLGLPVAPPPRWLPPLCDYRVQMVQVDVADRLLEVELDTTWEVVDRRSGAVLLSFEGHYSTTVDAGWGGGGWSGVADVRLAPDGRAVLVDEGPGPPRVVKIPGA